jgi:lipopolysaccharide/colanic/teichoic acid biosynthesis glycosyltransferase
MTPLELALKRAIDLAAAAGALAAAAPLLVGIGVAIRLDSKGPAFFRQIRLGRDGRRFTMLKFRTMTVGAGVEIDQKGSVANSSTDHRHTRVGRLLRRFSGDELPQLVNVLWGDMSIVGPRPDLPEALDFYTEEQRKRLAVRPGITGPAQVAGRNELKPHEKWDIEAAYAERASLATDFRIVARTFMAVISRNGIYGRTK